MLCNNALINSSNIAELYLNYSYSIPNSKNLLFGTALVQCLSVYLFVYVCLSVCLSV